MYLDYCPITKPIRTTAPTEAQEPITLNEAKIQCGIASDISYYDDYLRQLIKTARELVENDTGIVCYTGEYTWKLTEFPCGEWFEIRAIRPLTAITSITYINGSGATTTWGSTNYALETSAVVPLVRLTYAATWPGDSRGDLNGITITMTAGYATVAAVPARIKQAVLLLVNHWFVSRDIISIGAMSTGIEMTYDALINSIRRPSYP